MQIQGDLGDCAEDIGNCYGASETFHGNNYGQEHRIGPEMTSDIDLLIDYGDGNCAVRNEEIHMAGNSIGEG